MWNDGLGPQQEAAAGAARGNSLLIAGPGTGKTFVVVRRIQYLVDVLGMSPSRIAALTFTRAAAGEMRQRLEERLGASSLRVSTLHSFALRELLAHRSGAIQRPVRVVDDWEERHIVEEELAHALGRTVLSIRETLALLADDWDSLAADGEGWEEGFGDPAFLTAWSRHRAIYSYTLRSELVYQLLKLYRTNPTLTPVQPIEVLLVDEYQDLNLCDLRAIKIVADRAGGEIMATGDDDQSIYSFRHAHPEGIRRFGDDYPGAQVLKLEQCYRCGPEIVHLAGWVISQELGRIPKSLTSVTAWDADVELVVTPTEAAEEQAIAGVIARMISEGTEPSEILVLLPSDKNGAMSKDLVNALKGVSVEAYLPRAALGATKDVQILTEYLRLAQAGGSLEEDDLAIRSLLELDDNGIGATRIRAVVQAAWEREERFTEALAYLAENPSEYTSRGLTGLLDAVSAIRSRAAALEQREGERFSEWIERAVETLGLHGDALAVVQEAASYVEESVAVSAGDHMSQGLSYVQELVAALVEIKDSRPPRVDGSITITTMHGSKGLSADVVFVLHAEDEIIPNGKKGIQHDESRRLLYVSLSRARKHLYIHVCNERQRREFVEGGGAPRSRSLTRFLADYGLTAVTGLDR